MDKPNHKLRRLKTLKFLKREEARIYVRLKAYILIHPKFEDTYARQLLLNLAAETHKAAELIKTQQPDLPGIPS
jgi:hypothetical protein